MAQRGSVHHRKWSVSLKRQYQFKAAGSNCRETEINYASMSEADCSSDLPARKTAVLGKRQVFVTHFSSTPFSLALLNSDLFRVDRLLVMTVFKTRRSHYIK
ncbi:hypothetical protein CEXT_234101 [Caerostris extrusa]|uniref:Uncharacterized protein n=1 Tax=Caerostris extrusa TaxID=172846 RepID=A0AAV4X203_CAEEX|nr:hypothetical protein CEXT_234101 [Caerostris extrusa]